MKEKLDGKNNKEYLKIHVVVNVKTKKILAIKKTGEHFHDSKSLPELVNDIIKSDSMKAIGKLFADGFYNDNNIFRCIF